MQLYLELVLKGFFDLYRCHFYWIITKNIDENYDQYLECHSTSTAKEIIWIGRIKYFIIVLILFQYDVWKNPEKSNISTIVQLENLFIMVTITLFCRILFLKAEHTCFIVNVVTFFHIIAISHLFINKSKNLFNWL